MIFRRLSIAPVSGQPWEDFQFNHLVLAFLVAARFANPIVSLQPYQFARDTCGTLKRLEDAMSENEKPKKPLATDVIANLPRRDSYSPKHGSGNPHLEPGELQKVWHPAPKPGKPKK